MPTIQPQVPTQTITTAARTAKSTLGKDDFLSLLVTQMRYQDPMNPMQGAEFAAQLAQFSSLEQLTNINSNLQESLTANSLLSGSINNALSATFIGKEVRATSDAFGYTGAGSVKLGYSLPDAAETTVVKILDSAGNVIRTIDGGTARGQNTLTWDGRNDRGETAGAGNYTFKVEAKDSAGDVLEASTSIYGKVAGVRFKSSGTVFVIDGVEISLANVVEIMQG
jgi:flagellar basal-body rod modification protein FlgD